MSVMSDRVAGFETAGITAEYQADGERFGVFDIGGGRLYWFYMHDMPAGDVGNLARDQLAARAADWPAPVRAAIAATPPDRLLPFAIHARPAPRRLGQGRILCVGDAAHAMEPNLGQGACQTLEDAVALGAVASSYAPEAILPAYEKLRLRRIRDFVRQSSDGHHSAHGDRLKQRIVRAALRATPAAIERLVLARMHTMPPYALASREQSGDSEPS